MCSRSRGALRPRCAGVSPTREEGAGNAGCTLHPRSRVQEAHGNAHTSIQVQRKHSGIPCAMALRLMPCSPRRRIRLVTVAAGLMTDRPGWIKRATGNLTPATGARTTRFCRTHQRRTSCAPRSLTVRPPCKHISRTTLPRPPQPVPTFVTMANAPLLGTGWQESSVDLPDGLSGKFLREVLDRLLSDLPVVLVCRRSVAKFRLRTQRRASQ